MIKEDSIDSTKNQNEREISPKNLNTKEKTIEKALRPKNFSEYIGQEKIKNQHDTTIGINLMCSNLFLSKPNRVFSESTNK